MDRETPISILAHLDRCSGPMLKLIPRPSALEELVMHRQRLGLSAAQLLCGLRGVLENGNTDVNGDAAGQRKNGSSTPQIQEAATGRIVPLMALWLGAKRPCGVLGR